ncbi:MAG: 1-acyl-sn-glycerol-3-phosphate acyltransferase [Actinomycetota bacterium]|nr:1-acyl-sn-glycerol-3-phosphate acyltransferase [Actinomycetota bacterium]
MSVATMAARAVCCSGILIRGSMVFTRARFFSPGNRQRIARRWSCLLIAALGIRLDVRGLVCADRGPVGVLHVANHISWIDHLALLATFPLPTVAKREVEHWPVIGRFARALGTVFIDRDSLRSLPMEVARVSELLLSGTGVLVTPEGTAWCGAAIGRFRPAMFQAAIDAGAVVRPVAIRYRTEGRPTSTAAFVGDDSLIRSLRRVIATRGLVVEVHSLPELPARISTDRRALALLAEYSIAEITEACASAVARHPMPTRPRPPAVTRTVSV